MNWILENLPLIAERTLSHLALSVPPIILTLVLSIPLAWVGNRLGRARGIFISVLGVVYAIPSLALFLLIPLVIGGSIRSDVNVIVVLTIYGVAIMTGMVADAFRSVDRDILLAASAQGFSPARSFFEVELPLAGPVVLAALRVIAVSTVSLVTVSGALGTPNLGLLFLDGFQRNIPEEIFAGILMVVVIALACDLALVGLGRLILPWNHIVNGNAARAKRAPRTVRNSARVGAGAS